MALCCHQNHIILSMSYRNLNFYRAIATHIAVLLRQVVCPSVCPFMMLRYRDHIGCNTSKVFHRQLAWGVRSFQTQHHIMDLLQREHHEILSGIGVGYGKWLSAYKSSKPLIISETGQDRTKVTIVDQ